MGGGAGAQSRPAAQEARGLSTRPVLVLDSGGVTFLAGRSSRAAALAIELRRGDLWPPVIPSVVLVESLTGHAGRDTRTNRLLKACDVVDGIPVALARRAALLRTRAGRGSAVDALVVAFAEPGGTVLTTDPGDLRALASRAERVRIEAV